MKTAEQWIKESGEFTPRRIADTNCDQNEACCCERCKCGTEIFILPDDIKAIQLDAFKEGVMKAMCQRSNEKTGDTEWDSGYNQALREYERAIGHFYNTLTQLPR